MQRDGSEGRGTTERTRANDEGALATMILTAKHTTPTPVTNQEAEMTRQVRDRTTVNVDNTQEGGTRRVVWHQQVSHQTCE